MSRPFIGRNHMENNKELLDKFNWAIKFVTYPAGVYFPGEQLFYGRIKGVSGLPTYSHSVQEVEGPGGFKVIQGGDVDHNSANPTITFLDYEDSSIFYTFKNWMDTIQDPVTKIAAPKDLVVCDIDIYQLNTSGGQVIKWMFRTGMPNSFDGYNTDFSTKREVQQDLSIPFTFEWWDNQMMNV